MDILIEIYRALEMNRSSSKIAMVVCLLILVPIISLCLLSLAVTSSIVMYQQYGGVATQSRQAETETDSSTDQLLQLELEFEKYDVILEGEGQKAETALLFNRDIKRISRYLNAESFIADSNVDMKYSYYLNGLDLQMLVVSRSFLKVDIISPNELAKLHQITTVDGHGENKYITDCTRTSEVTIGETSLMKTSCFELTGTVNETTSNLTVIDQYSYCTYTIDEGNYLNFKYTSYLDIDTCGLLEDIGLVRVSVTEHGPTL